MKPTVEEIVQSIKEVIAEEIAVEPAAINTDQNFQDMGLDSLSSIFMLNKIEQKYEIELQAMHIWNHPTIDSLSTFVHSLIYENA